MSVRALTVDDGAVLLDAPNGRFVDLNDSAAELWVVLTENSFSRSALLDHLAERYSIDDASAQGIADGFVRDLAAGGLVISTID